MTRYRYAFIDPSVNTVVVACGSCSHWSAVTLSRSAAYKTKADHDERVHGVEPERAQHAGKMFDSRSGVSPEVE